MRVDEANASRVEAAVFNHLAHLKVLGYRDGIQLIESEQSLPSIFQRAERKLNQNERMGRDLLALDTI